MILPQTSPEDSHGIFGKIDNIADAVKEGFAGVQEGTNAMKDEVKAGFDETRGGFKSMSGKMDELGGKVDEVKGQLQEINQRLKSLQADNYPYPQHFIVREVDAGGTSSGTKETMRQRMRRFRDRARGKVHKEMALHFLCSDDMSVVPCGFGGEGFRFLVTRDWAMKLAPVLQVSHTLTSVLLDQKEAKASKAALSGLD